MSSWSRDDVIIAPGRSYEFALYFDGSDRDAGGRLELLHNDSTGGTEVSMEVAAGPPSLAISPSLINFSSVALGEPKTMGIANHNVGNIHVTLTEFGTNDTIGTVTLEATELSALANSTRHQLIEVTVSPQTDLALSGPTFFVRSDAVDPIVNTRTPKDYPL